MRYRCFLSPTTTTVLYLFLSVFILGSVACVYSWLALSPTYSYSSGSGTASASTSTSSAGAVGCNPDGEGSWSVGIFYGDSPFSLKPIESMNMWRNGSSAWPVANPVLTCALPSDSGFPSNFVADPFLHIQGDTFYLFFETKNSITLKGDIGVASSDDKGATWKYLGIALSEDWHLSYPYVFRFNDQLYMLPEGNHKGDLRLYRALNFPLEWKLEKIIIDKPLIDSFIINYQSVYWLFGSDFSRFGAKKNGELEIWHSNSPLGPWTAHKKNPIHNIDRSLGARNAGRPFIYNGNLYRTGQDCGETYGRGLRVFRIDILTRDDYKEVEVTSGIEESRKGRNAWNGARYHHLDAQQLPSGKWIAVMDGDRVPSGDNVKRLVKGYIALAFVVILVMLVGVLIGAVRCVLLLSQCLPISGKRSDVLQVSSQHPQMSVKVVGWIFTRVNRVSTFLQGRIKLNTCKGRSIMAVVFLVGVVLACTAIHYIHGGSGAEEAYPLKGHYSQFTLLTMTYDARLWNLKMFVKHYSRCSSVREIVVVWNKGQPPNIDDLDSSVPVRVRVEKENSLNNRFRVDPLIKTKAVLELDDDIMMTCDDVERGFRVWREHPDRLVGFYPRLADGTPLEYRDERYARRKNRYNMILTGAAFVDQQWAFTKYWSKDAEKGREFVDKQFNCEDVLMNFLYVNSSSSKMTVEYVRPNWAIDTSKFSGVAISRNTQVHYKIRSECLNMFSTMYGNLDHHKREFRGRGDGWDL